MEQGRFSEILAEVMTFPDGLYPEGNIITGVFTPREISSLVYNISPNPQSGGSINDTLYRKLIIQVKNEKLERYLRQQDGLTIICRPFCCYACCPAWFTRIMLNPIFPRGNGVEHCQKERRLAN
jgi:hypothetical protein